MLMGSFIAFIGVGCVIFNSSFNLQVRPLGDVLSILAAFSWAIYSLVLRKINVVYDLWFITRKTFFYGVLTAIPFVLSKPLNNPLELLGGQQHTRQSLVPRHRSFDDSLLPVG